MFKQILNRNFYLVFFTDLIVLGMAVVLAFMLRFDFNFMPQYSQQFQTMLMTILPVKVFVFICFGMYRGMWRYTDLRDSWKLAQATVLSEILGITILAWWVRFAGYPRSLFILDALLTFVLTGGVRVAIRTFFLFRGQLNASPFLSFEDYTARRQNLKKVVIAGAGDVGVRILREIIENPRLNYEVAGFVDDDVHKQKRFIHGISVLGGIEHIKTLVEECDVSQVLIAMPSANGEQMRRVVTCCDAAKVVYKTLPAIGDLIDGSVSINQFREVSYQDLLGREPVVIQNAAVSAYLSNKVVMVTGAGGSIGSELVRQIVRFSPACLILFERSEVGLYSIQMELEHEFGYQNNVPVLGRVQDKELVNQILARYKPETIFHAAAYKHVPMIEGNPWEGVFNNIWGSHIVMQAAARHQVKRFVLVSTDKAVRPTNVMGTTKRVTELLLQSFPACKTKFMAVRFGNVLGSSGSVIPLFQKQIKKGGPLTVTHPDMTRYFMTIPEACQLILQAGTMGQGGEIFILKMGTPVKIADMARDLIRLSGKIPDVDIKIEFTGIRPGEKLYEELITYGEGIVPTGHEEIMVLRPESDTSGVLAPGYRERLEKQVGELTRAAKTYDSCLIKSHLSQIVPEYECSDCSCVLTGK